MKRLASAFYFDTYALVEITLGAEKYLKFREGVGILTNKLNLMELAYFMLRIKHEDKIDAVLRVYLRYNVEPSFNAMIEAVKMKFLHRKQKLSYIDCLGYMIARENNIKFLTGDEKFRNMDNVEFVK